MKETLPKVIPSADKTISDGQTTISPTEKIISPVESIRKAVESNMESTPKHATPQIIFGLKDYPRPKIQVSFTVNRHPVLAISASKLLLCLTSIIQSSNTLQIS